MKIKFDPNQRYQILRRHSSNRFRRSAGSRLMQAESITSGNGSTSNSGKDGSLIQIFGHCGTASSIDGIKYERIEDAEYEMMLFEQHELLGYLSRIVPVEHSIYDAVELDSDVERNFALALDQRSDIKLFIKLPSWFKIDTPLGSYNPDWAIVKQCEGEEERLYLIRETKGSTDVIDLRSAEAAKLRCGQAHFKTLDVDFKTVTDASAV